MNSLTVSRKQQETIHVDGPAIIRISRIHGSRVDLTVHAERSTRVLRGELVDQPAARAADGRGA